MNSLQIEKLVYNHHSGNNFGGVFSSDTLPSNPILGKSYIVNTDEFYKPGEHWVALFFPLNDQPEYFDSYGLPPLKEYFYSFLGGFPFFYYNNITLQTPFSSICGEYCIYYVIHRMLGYTPKDVLSIFNENDLEHNNEVIKKFMKETFNLKIKISNKKYISSQISMLFDDNRH